MIKDRFLELINTYSEDLSYNQKCWDQIEKQYTHKSRYYHCLKHIEDMLELFDIVEKEVEQKDALLFAIFYHDLIYKVTSKKNEYKSALTFKKYIKPTSFTEIDRTFNLILATQMHQLSEDRDTNILLDLDLNVLGKSQAEYQNYTQGVRREYSIYPDFLYKKGRVQVLNRFLETYSIYKTVYFQNRFEKQARRNLKNELDLLTSK